MTSLSPFYIFTLLDQAVELFDLESDISEKESLTEKNPEIVARLSHMMTDFNRKLEAKSRPAGRIGK